PAGWPRRAVLVPPEPAKYVHREAHPGDVRRRLQPCPGGSMKNREVAAVLNELADTMELLGEDRYRMAGYRDAATRVEHYAEPIENLARDGRITQIHGVGKSIGAK